MSIRLMTFVWDHAPVKGSQLNVLLILADHANDEGRCWPSMGRIAHRARMSERQTRRVVHALSHEGLLDIEERGGRPSVYTVLLEGRTSTTGGTYGVDTPDIAVSPEPPIEPPSGSSEKEPSLTRSQEVRPTATQLERESIERVWSNYLALIPSRRVLDDKRRRIIRNALHTIREAQQCDLTVAEDLVNQAIRGLSLSPHHNGQNEQRRSYLEIRYALKGIGDESDDDRIEKAILWAAAYAPDTFVVDEEKVQRWLDEVRYHLGKQATHPGSTSGRDRALESYRKLTTAGFQVIRLDRPPYARLSR